MRCRRWLVATEGKQTRGSPSASLGCAPRTQRKEDTMKLMTIATIGLLLLGMQQVRIGKLERFLMNVALDQCVIEAHLDLSPEYEDSE